MPPSKLQPSPVLLSGTTNQPPGASEIEQALLHHAAQAEPRTTFCPSEVARALTGSHPDQWGPVMTPLRRIAVGLAQAGKLVIYRKGKPADPNDFKGVYRLGPSCIE